MPPDHSERAEMTEEEHRNEQGIEHERRFDSHEHDPNVTHERHECHHGRRPGPTCGHRVQPGGAGRRDDRRQGPVSRWNSATAACASSQPPMPTTSVQ